MTQNQTTQYISKRDLVHLLVASPPTMREYITPVIGRGREFTHEQALEFINSRRTKPSITQQLEALPEGRFLTASEASLLARCSISYLYKKIEEGEIRAFRTTPCSYRLLKADIEALAECIKEKEERHVSRRFKRQTK